MGNFLTGVCVIAAEPAGEAPFGMTVNSFSSVSLDPPLILWSLKNDSDCFDLFEKTQQFSVNVLTAEQACISTKYATKGNHALIPEHYCLGVSGVPVIKNTLASFECQMWERYAGGDHVIIVGEVKSFGQGTNDNGRPLIFHAGKYTALI